MPSSSRPTWRSLTGTWQARSNSTTPSTLRSSTPSHPEAGSMAAIALFLLAACAQAAAETAAAQQRPKPAPPCPLEASLGLLWDRYEDPGRIEATIWLKNVSKRPIIILKGDVGDCCTLECTGPDGVKGPKLSGGHVGSQSSAPDVLKPGETYVAKATHYTGNVVCRDLLVFRLMTQHLQTLFPSSRAPVGRPRCTINLKFNKAKAGVRPIPSRSHIRVVCPLGAIRGGGQEALEAPPRSQSVRGGGPLPARGD